jgi:hypothetical protein
MALEDGGITREKLSGSDTGVYIGRIARLFLDVNFGFRLETSLITKHKETINLCTKYIFYTSAFTKEVEKKSTNMHYLK